jgi:hypothetical protein
MNGSHPQDETSAFDASELANRIRQGDLPVVNAPDPLAPGDQCHFVAAVRFGRRRADQFGHLLLTSGWLKFRGTLDLSVTWSEIADVQRAVREIVVSLHDRRRLLRFSCHSAVEAASGALIAQQLAQSARVLTAEPGAAYEQNAAL